MLERIYIEGKDISLPETTVSQARNSFELGGYKQAVNLARQAIEEINPFGLDLCSGVRTEGRLDPVKLSAFFDVVNS